jgi:hypothetical protein
VNARRRVAGRLAGAVYLTTAGLLGPGLHAVGASEAAVLGALTFLGISVPPGHDRAGRVRDAGPQQRRRPRAW